MSEIKKNATAYENVHSVIISNRSDMNITGVNEVSEFSDDLVKLQTQMGVMIIKGSELSVTKLNTDTGEVEISGSFDLIEYSKNKKGGFLTGLLK